MLRAALLSSFALGLAAGIACLVPGVGAGASTPETFSIDDGRGVVILRGSGVVIGRLGHGEVQIVDLSPIDQWSPRLNGVPRGKVVWTKGRSVNFFVPGGRYRITVKGDGISVSARGQGVVTIDGRPDAVGDAGSYSIGDGDDQPVGDGVARFTFGGQQ